MPLPAFAEHSSWIGIGFMHTDFFCLLAQPSRMGMDFHGFWLLRCHAGVLGVLKIRADPSHPCDSGRNPKDLCAYKFIPNPSWISIDFMHTDFFVCLRRLHGWGTDFHVYFIEGIWGVFSCWDAVRVIDVGKLLWIDFGRWRGGDDGAEARGERQKEALTSRRASPCSTKPQWSSFR